MDIFDFDLAYTTLKNKFAKDKPTHSEISEFIDQLGMISPNVLGFKDELIEKYENNIGIKSFEIKALDGEDGFGDWFEKESQREGHTNDYFERYAAYLRDEDFPEDTIAKMKHNCEFVLKRCANPAPGNNEKKKGLVMGDVQSGKTANYLGLINMACDYGYKVIVVLAGLTDSLRIQTQKRIDSGFVGAKSSSISKADIIYLGVGENNKTHFAVPLTNDVSDFAKAVQEANNGTRDDYNKPVVLVVKKNKSTLSNLNTWLKPGSQNLKYNNILIIDDEADNASVNTAKDPTKPSQINNLIRALFNNFDIASYVGYTATPFANVFINPDDENGNADLFPSNFVALLRGDSNYFGASKVFANNGRNQHIKLLDESEPAFLDLFHGKDDDYYECAESLKESIRMFFINSAIRSLRGKINAHRSMMINISRFTKMHYKIGAVVEKYVTTLKNIISQRSFMSQTEFLCDPEMKKMYDLYMTDKIYNSIRLEVSWEDIQKSLPYEANLMEVFVLNGTKNSQKLNYEDYKELGARAIIVGGFVLSRGLTLEGLMVSYYNRNGSAYDTLLQMCRWFGYRPGYEDLCRIYMTEDNVAAFLAAVEATNDLVEQFNHMIMLQKTPNDFGLMIKQTPEVLETDLADLLITARNKSRNSIDVDLTLNYSAQAIDTSKFEDDYKINEHNKLAFEKFIDALNRKFEKDEAGRYIIKDVSNKHIALILKDIKVSSRNKKFDAYCLSEYIGSSEKYTKWDVVVPTGSKSESVERILPGLDSPICIPTRSFKIDEKGDVKTIKIAGERNRLTDPGIFNSGLALDDIKKVRATKDTPTAKDYLSVDNRKPLFVIHPIWLKGGNDKEQIRIQKEFGDNGNYLLGFAIGFPKSGDGVMVKYKVNQRKYEEMMQDRTNMEDDEYDDED